MTYTEIYKIKNYCFETLWCMLWVNNINYNFTKHADYIKAKNKFLDIKKGYFIKRKLFMNLDKLLKSKSIYWDETEWGLPKGKRNPKEKDIDTAKREFSEETNINKKNIIILQNYEPLIEEYIGSDNIKYKHIYYIAKLTNNKINVGLNNRNFNQISEISDVKFMTLNTAFKKIRNYYTKKKEILKNIEYKIKNDELYNIKLKHFIY